FPSQYQSYALREHRWVRGDWQILPWLLRRIPGADGEWHPNPLPGMERWKIFDNLRRSLLAPALIALFFLAWIMLPQAIATVSVLALSALFWPVVLQFIDGLTAWIDGLIHGRGGAWLRPGVSLTAAQASIQLCLLAEQAWLMVDAIGRTVVRLALSKRRLLEW